MKLRLWRCTYMYSKTVMCTGWKYAEPEDPQPRCVRVSDADRYWPGDIKHEQAMVDEGVYEFEDTLTS